MSKVIAPWFYGVFFLISVACLGIYKTGFLPELAGFLFKEVGFAGLVALALVFSIEKFSRKQHEEAAHQLMESINNNIFKAIYHRYIPPSVFQEVEDCLLNCDVVRKGYTIEYTLSHLTKEQEQKSTHGDHLSCDIFTKYRLVNVKKTKITQTIMFAIETPIDPEFSSDTEITAVSISNKELSRQEIIDNTTINGDEHLFTYDVEIEPRAEVDITMQGKTIKKQTDVEVFSSKLPSDGVTLNVCFAHDLEIFAKANNSKKFVLKTSPVNKKIWVLDGGVFPHQSFVFWWKPKETLTESAANENDK